MNGEWLLFWIFMNKCFRYQLWHIHEPLICFIITWKTARRGVLLTSLIGNLFHYSMKYGPWRSVIDLLHIWLFLLYEVESKHHFLFSEFIDSQMVKILFFDHQKLCVLHTHDCCRSTTFLDKCNFAERIAWKLNENTGFFKVWFFLLVTSESSVWNANNQVFGMLTIKSVCSLSKRKFKELKII